MKFFCFLGMLNIFSEFVSDHNKKKGKFVRVV